MDTLNNNESEKIDSKKSNIIYSINYNMDVVKTTDSASKSKQEKKDSASKSKQEKKDSESK